MVVSVVGLGFVGLTTALGLSEYGHKVYGIETNMERLGIIQEGKLPFFEPGLDELLSKKLNRSFFPVSDLKEAMRESEIIYFCVGTPYGENGEADLTMLFAAMDSCIDAIDDELPRIFVTKSTIPPSTSFKRIIPAIKERTKGSSKNIIVANNPEFLREGHCYEDFMNSDFVIVGVEDEYAKKRMSELYENSSAPLCFVSLNTGEFVKYLSNSTLACLISFANEMANAADAIGDIEIADAFRILHNEKRWKTGSIRNYFYPGCGYGGYCLPKDTNALKAQARNAGVECSILDNVIKTNDSMPEISAHKIINACQMDPSRNIGILGLSFNKDSDDCRESPSAKIIGKLLEKGYSNIFAYDPISNGAFRKLYDFPIIYRDRLSEVLEEADVLVIATAWDEFRELNRKTNRKIVDLRYML